jgi:anion-transporting  ArsA/GET3 family ATPase
VSHRWLFVLGKGGVGRTSVAAATAIAAGRQGRRTLVVEMNGVWDIGRRFGHPASYEPRPIAENVWWRSLTTRDCMADFGRTKLKLGRVGARVMSSRPFRAFVDAVPGLPDLLQLGRIENLLNEPGPDDPVYDLVVVDAPATGHGLSLLAAPSTMTELTESGPFHELASIIADALADPSTGLLVTTLAEQLPYTETTELLDTLERSPLHVAGVIVNRVLSAPLPDRSKWPIVRDALPPGDRLHRLAELVDTVDAAAIEQERVLGHLLARTEASSVAVDVVPWIQAEGGVVRPAQIADHLVPR